MDTIHTTGLRQVNDAVNVEVGGHGPFPLAYEVRLVGLKTVHPKAVLLRINRDCAVRQFGSTAENSYRDFTAVCDKQFFLHIK